MDLVLKNITPKDYNLVFDLANHLGIQVEEMPDHASIIDDLTEAINEIKMAEAGELELQNAKDLILELY